MSRNTALLIIDVQNRFKKTCEENCIVEKIVHLVKIFRHKNLPTVATQHHDDPRMTSLLSRWWGNPLNQGSEDWQIVPALRKVLDIEDDLIITDKTRYDAFWGTSLRTELLKMGIDTVVICGALTNLSCESTARGAFMNDFSVIFLSDANAFTEERFHEATLTNLEHGFATIMTCEELLRKYENVSR
ncbi:nicotinamidase 2 [Lingula anatina]|uniref:Nicotinamidase 2 n=1 Tax=Lingula anatina TaxID=7574 RepID=A0A1S3HSX7_LINAN|nr:nicotinamidase 2 [Lingula anatina]XP_013388657.1 nicotinamidase 2 [Lingula anatina]|eukprot:XP_013388656.1 nicotinamidase 2 [Lingula anatina]